MKRKAVKEFMNEGNLHVPELDDPKWVMDLAYFVDITQEVNMLILKLQDPNQLVTVAFDSVKAFFINLKLWKAQLTEHVSSQHVNLSQERVLYLLVMTMLLPMKTYNRCLTSNFLT